MCSGPSLFSDIKAAVKVNGGPHEYLHIVPAACLNKQWVISLTLGSQGDPRIVCTVGFYCWQLPLLRGLSGSFGSLQIFTSQI
jgi:hypothetical protein